MVSFDTYKVGIIRKLLNASIVNGILLDVNGQHFVNC